MELILNNIQKHKQHPASVFAFHCSFLFLLYLILSFFGLITDFPSEYSLNHFDVSWYQSIITDGYSSIEGRQSNVAFFPLFPFIWKMLNIGNIGMGIVNLFFLGLGILILARTYKLSSKTTLLLCSTPSLFFCYIPYSEALFFLAGSIIIYGFRNNYWWLLVGVFMACITRSASIVFIPILLFTMFFTFQKVNRNQVISKTFGLILVALIATGLVAIIQYFDSGEVQNIFSTQSAWNRTFTLPSFPFTTWDEARLIWLDGFGLIVAFTAISILIGIIVSKFKRHKNIRNQEFIFSLGYLGSMGLITLFFSGIDAAAGTTFYSLNRFIFATPFFMVFVIYILKGDFLSVKNFAFMVGVCLIVWLCFNLGGMLVQLDKFALPILKTKFYFGAATVYTLLYLWISRKENFQLLFSGFYLFNCFIQLILFNWFLKGIWIG